MMQNPKNKTRRGLSKLAHAYTQMSKYENLPRAAAAVTIAFCYNNQNSQQVAYLCMAKCYDNPRATSEQVQACAQRCERPLQEINQVVQQEINSFQARRQKLAMMVVILKCMFMIGGGTCDILQGSSSTITRTHTCKMHWWLICRRYLFCQQCTLWCQRSKREHFPPLPFSPPLLFLFFEISKNEQVRVLPSVHFRFFFFLPQFFRRNFSVLPPPHCKKIEEKREKHDNV